MSDILEDLLRVKKQEGNLDRFSYDLHGNYSIGEVKEEFGSWSKATNKISSSGGVDKDENPRGKGVSKNEIISDLRKAARSCSLPFTPAKYEKEGRYSSNTVSRNIGSWQEARKKADIKEIEKEKAAEMTHWLSGELDIRDDISGDVEQLIDVVTQTVDDKVVLGAFYCALRKNDLPFTMKDISCQLTDRDKQDVYEAYRRILAANKNKYLPTISIESFVERYCEELELPTSKKKKAIEEAKNIETQSSSPHTVAAALVYIVGKKSDKEITQRDVAEIANVTEVTIRNNKNKLEEEIEISSTG